MSLFHKGFTLIELLVTITILAVLSIVGVVAYQNVSKSTRDNKRIQDVSAIAKSLESKYPISNKYVDLTSSDMDGGVPKDPRGNDYFRAVTNDGKGYKVCAALDANTSTTCNTPATNCFCKVSQLSSVSTIPPSSYLTGAQISIGWGGTTSSSCDTNGTLGANLVGYWKFDEGSGTTTLDSSGGGNDLVFYTAGGGSISWSTGTDAKFGSAINITGTGNFIWKSTDVSLTTGNSTRSIVAWIKPTGTYNDNIYNGIVAYGNLVANQGEVLALRNNGYLMADQWSNYIFQTSGAAVTTNNWNLAIFTWDGTTRKLYLFNSNNFPGNNPQPVAEGLSTSPYTSGFDTQPGKIRIGYASVPGGSNRYFTGKIDDVRVYNKVLSSNEIIALYNNGSGCDAP